MPQAFGLECLNGGIDDRSGFISIILNINSLFPEGVFQKIILSIESYPSVINEKVASSHRRAQTSLTSLTQLVRRSQKGPCMHLSLGIKRLQGLHLLSHKFRKFCKSHSYIPSHISFLSGNDLNLSLAHGSNPDSSAHCQGFTWPLGKYQAD